MGTPHRHQPSTATEVLAEGILSPSKDTKAEKHLGYIRRKQKRITDEQLAKQLMEETKEPSGRSLAIKLAERFVFQPWRVIAVMKQFYERVFTNDKVLMEYVSILFPKDGKAGGTVIVNINSPLLQEKEGSHGITGEPIDAEYKEIIGSPVETTKPEKDPQ